MSNKAITIVLLVSCLFNMLYAAAAASKEVCKNDCDGAYKSNWTNALHNSKRDQHQNTTSLRNGVLKACEKIRPYLNCCRKCGIELKSLQLEHYEEICPDNGTDPLLCLVNEEYGTTKADCREMEEKIGRLISRTENKNASKNTTLELCSDADEYVKCMFKDIGKHCEYKEGRSMAYVIHQSLTNLIELIYGSKITNLSTCDAIIPKEESVDQLMKYASFKMKNGDQPIKSTANGFVSEDKTDFGSTDMKKKEQEVDDIESQRKRDVDAEDSTSSALSISSVIFCVVLSLALTALFQQ